MLDVDIFYVIKIYKIFQPMGDITASNVVPTLQQPLLPKLSLKPKPKQKLPHFLVHILVLLMVMVIVVIPILIMVTILTPSSALGMIKCQNKNVWSQKF